MCGLTRSLSNALLRVENIGLVGPHAGVFSLFLSPSCPTGLFDSPNCPLDFDFSSQAMNMMLAGISFQYHLFHSYRFGVHHHSYNTGFFFLFFFRLKHERDSICKFKSFSS